MSAVIESLKVCGFILSTEDFNFFALRCSKCKNKDFGQWSSYLRHLRKVHNNHSLSSLLANGDSNSNDEAVPADDEIEDEPELDHSPRGSICEENEEEMQEEAVAPNSLCETVKITTCAAATAEETEEEAPPQAATNDCDVVVKEEQLTACEDEDEASSHDHENYAEEEDGDTDIADETDMESTKEGRCNMFYFDLRDHNYKYISGDFLRMLEKLPVLWNPRHPDSSDTAKRTSAILDLKRWLKASNFDSNIEIIRSSIVQILRHYRLYAAESTSGKKQRFPSYKKRFLEQCSFLSSIDEDEFGEMRDIEGVSEDTPSSDDNRTIDSFENGRSTRLRGRRPEKPAEYLVSSNQRYQRIRFKLCSNPLALEFIRLVRENPVLWDKNYPNYNNKLDRRRLLDEWACTLGKKYEVYFSYDDMAANLTELKNFVQSLPNRQSLDSASQLIMNECRFLPLKSRTRIQCDRCKRGFLNEQKYQEHLYMVHGIGACPFRCEDCDLTFESRAESDAHRRLLHKDSQKYSCSFCDRCYSRNYQLQVHMAMHTGESRFICETCGKNFRRLANLKFHETRVHLRQRNFKCEQCPKAFYTKGLLQDHVNTHLNIRPFECPYCEKSFFSAHARMRHKKTHLQERQFPCKLCGAEYTKSSALNLHMQRRHHCIKSNQRTPVAADNNHRPPKEEAASDHDREAVADGDSDPDRDHDTLDSDDLKDIEIELMEEI